MIRQAERAGAKAGRFLSDIAEKHYTAIGVLIIALISFGLGVGLVVAPGKHRVPAFAPAFAIASPELWGAVWIGLAAVMAIIAGRSIIRHTVELRAARWPLLVLGTVWSVWSLFQVEAMIEGTGVPSGVVAYSGLALLAYFIALGCHFAGRR